MRFNQDFIEKVRDASNIAEIISQYSELKGGGGRLMGRCPYPDHSDKSPSFSVDENRQLFHCFGCKKGGDVFNFLETYNGIAFPEAIEYLARRASIALPEPEPGQRRPNGASQESKELFYKLNRAAAVYWHRCLRELPETDSTIGYLKKRGISPEIVETFRLGVAPPEWDSLVAHLDARKAPLLAAETLGLIRKRKPPAAGYFDLFRERIMFPIFSPSGETVGFGGRAYGDGTPKYLNSPETPVFSKGRTLYGLHETGKFIRSQDEAIVVEGYMDAISLYSAGIKNVAAILGTALTADHAKILKRYSAKVIMLLDGDDAGQNAAERSLPILLHAGVQAKGYVLPDKLDPDDFVRSRGPETLRAELDRAPELFSLVLARNLVGYSGAPGEKVRVVEELAPALRAIANPQLRELYFQEMAQRLDVGLDWLRKTALAAMKGEQAAAEKAAGRRSDFGSNSDQAAPKSGFAARPHEGEAGSRGGMPGGGLATEASLTGDGREIVSLKGAPRDEAFVLSLALQDETLLASVRAESEGAGSSDEPSHGAQGEATSASAPALRVESVRLVDALTHAGIKRMFAIALARYELKPEEFAKLAASLSSQTDVPQLLSSSIEIVETSRKMLAKSGHDETERLSEALRNVFSDYSTAIRKRHLKNQAKALANQLRDGAQSGDSSSRQTDKLERIMNLVRDRHSLDRETS